MTLCQFCNQPIPKTRFDKWHKSHNVKYCSVRCNKRAYYVRKHKNKSSIFYNTKKWQNTATGKAYQWEEFAKNLLNAKRPSKSLNTPVDLIWQNKNIDVKVSSLYKRKRKRGKKVNSQNQIGWWTFNRNDFKEQIDYFFCIGLVKKIPYKIFLIPNKEFSKSGTSISPKKSKYDKYLL